jgi:hypothetical protein
VNAVLLAGILAGCGAGEPRGAITLTLTLSGAAPVAASFDLRVFGAKVTCDKPLSTPDAFATGKSCEASAADTAEDCHLAHVLLNPGTTTRIADLSAGRRAVFVIGLDGAKAKVSKGCATVDIKAGAPTPVTLNVSAY